MSLTILIVEDEPVIAELVEFNLRQAGYTTMVATDGIRALEMAVKVRPDLIILDLMLPGVDGFEVCRRLRGDGWQVPILILTARGDEEDKITGLEIGADDYLTKPFSPRELVARVKAILRRSGEIAGNPVGNSKILKIGRLGIDPLRYRVTIGDAEISLTLKEFELLKTLAINPGQVFSREILLEKLWGYEYIGDTRTVDVHIRRLREKIELDPANPVYIKTVRGVGYKFQESES